MGILDWLHPVSRQCLTRADAALWAEARDLPDLGRLTAMWLRGEIRSQPGYYGSVDVDEEEAPGLTDALVACNFAGLLTSNSQAGFDGLGHDGAHWTQLAAVCGYADDETLAWLVADVMQPGPYEVRAWKASGWRPLNRWGPDEDCCHVTFREGKPFTTFGRHTKGDAAFSYDGCGGEAVAAVLDAWQVTVYDPEPGRNDLWADLHDAAQARLDYLSNID